MIAWMVEFMIGLYHSSADDVPETTHCSLPNSLLKQIIFLSLMAKLQTKIYSHDYTPSLTKDHSRSAKAADEKCKSQCVENVLLVHVVLLLSLDYITVSVE